MVLAIAVLLLQAPALTQSAATVSPGNGSEAANSFRRISANSPATSTRFANVKLIAEVPAGPAKEAAASAAAQPADTASSVSIRRTIFSESSSDAASAALSGTYLPVPGEAPPGYIGGPVESRNTNRAWFALVLAGHSAATLDAWSTRHALTNGGMREADPLMRPFAHSAAIYAAIQVAPTILDFVGRRMSRSQHAWARKIWWVPQAAMTAGFLFSGAHNLANSR